MGVQEKINRKETKWRTQNHGLEKNRANLERFVGYSLAQGLMAKKMTVEELFLPLN
jgi:hypothetical protein